MCRSLCHTLLVWVAALLMNKDEYESNRNSQYMRTPGSTILRDISQGDSDVEPMDTVWEDVCLKVLDRVDWTEWTARCSHWID